MQLVISLASSPAPGQTLPDEIDDIGDIVLDVNKHNTVDEVVTAAAQALGLDPAPLRPAPRPDDPASDDPASDDPDQPRPYRKGILLPADATIEQAGMLRGDLLDLDSPAPPRDADWRPAEPGVDWLEIHAVSGPDAGRIWPLELGTHGIGRAPGSWVTLSSADVPERGPEVAVDRHGRAWLAGLGGHKLTQTGMTLADETATVEGGRLSLPEPPREEVGAPDPQYAKVIEDAAREYAEMMQGSQGARRWQPGMDLAIGETLLRLVHRFDADAAVSPSVDEIARDFNRPPRLVPPLTQPPVKLPVPPKPPVQRRFPLLMMLSPMVIGIAFVFLFHSVYFVLITLISPIMMIANWVQDRRSGARRYREDSATYRQRRKDAEHKVFETVNREREARCQASPDPAMVGLIATGPGSRLWERRRTDGDFLMARFGTVDQPSLMELDDPAREDGQRRYRWKVPDVPIGLSIADRGVVGIAGPAHRTASVARWLVTQAATLHSPRDLRIYLLAGPGVGDGPAAMPERWAWARWLPHVRPHAAGPGSPLLTFGNDPETLANRVNELLQLIKARQEARGSRMGTVLFADPDILVVMDGARWLRDVPGVMKILVEGPAVRVFSVAVDLMDRLLPEECTAVVQVGEQTLTLRQVNQADVSGIRPDDVSRPWCENVARALSSLRDVTPDEVAGLPERVRMMELLGLPDVPTGQQIADRWSREPFSTVFPLGSGFDGPVHFDLVTDGPHGLVAGTTGSGKSELLQSLVISLATLNRPDELVFVLVDYKGGSAFHACVNLPHTLGMVTDLDEALALRALDSFAAELRRREHMLAQAGAKDLPEYQAIRARTPELAPMPRLLLVIDEFATMAREAPSFVPGLVSIAQRGRSLGIHLILATQRPAGVVTSDIKANTNLRIALRVTDPGESSDVIDTHDAAHISTRTPGRALARLGHRSVMPFQAGYVGGTSRQDQQPEAPEQIPAPVAERLTWSGLGRPVSLRRSGPARTVTTAPGDQAPRTDLDELVDAVQEATQLTGCAPQPRPWLPALSGRLLLEELDEADRQLGIDRRTVDRMFRAPFARADLPGQQEQRTLYFDPSSDGHLFVIGAPRAGRSQVLRTVAGALARDNSSADLHIYGIEAAGSALGVLTDLPHCGGVVPRSDIERLGRLIRLLMDEVDRRHQLLGKASAADLPELRAKLPAGQAPAHLVVFVDGWDPLAATLTDHDGGDLYAQMQEILREGAGVGIHLVMTSDRVLLGGRVASLSDNKLIMRMTERSDMSLTGLPISRIPPVISPGRAWRPQDQLEVQVALLGADPSGEGQARALREIGRTTTARDFGIPQALRPVSVPPMPSELSFADAFGLWPQTQHQPLKALLGLADGGTTPLTVDFAGRENSFAVVGPAGSGRSNVLCALGISLLANGTRLVVLSPRESPLRRMINHRNVDVLVGLHPEPEELRKLIDAEQGPTVVLIDDVDLLGPSHPVGAVLREIAATGRDHELGMAFAGSPELVVGTGGGWIGEAKRSRQGILLAPQNSMESDLLGARLTHSQVRTQIRPGRGYTTLGARPGKVHLIAVPLTQLK
ncbi:FtsK/SpoIIIE domain-containing protein [Kineosporia sp. NBRC 101731]|uniref:FtsK/SpoIIIE domain-containing protein n=1 Tax=Kineosporia sp. NBRC 101731 TaxID=3032199 RepID=UPI0024A4DB6F|nr:FtsK/SpoIIIE domain-containing protein [Kineosporia sp. NBRC 101731]GLY29868.1 cell division protein FtsK [Kineosporia sp. NBRC 101731]